MDRLDFDVDDTPRSGRFSEFDENCLGASSKEDGHQTSVELPKKMNCDRKTILYHLHAMGFAEKLGAWTTHELNENILFSTSRPPSSNTRS